MLDGVAVNDVLRALAPGLVRLLVNPLLYAGAGLVLWDVWRNARHERAFFGVRVTRRRRLVLALAGLSALGGALVSAWDVALRAAVGPGEVWAVSVFALLLALIRPRWLSPLYAATLLATVAGVAAWAAPGGAGTGWTGGWPAPSELGRVAWAVVDGFHTAGWAALLAGVTLCEALLLALFQTRRLRPVYVLSKRGRAIGAFAMHLAFVLPVWLPLAGTSAAAGLPAWAGAGFTAVPAAIGFGGVFAGLPTRRVLAAVCLRDLGIALLLAAGAFVGRSMGSGWALLALWLAVGTAEGVRLWVDRAEAAADPLFAPSPDGVRVLATLPGSLAEAMGLAPGEVITHVNQIPVHTGYDLHFAFDQNPAYARLRVVDPRGEARLVGKPVYDGERVKLGLLLVPEDGQAPCYPSVPCGLLQTVGLRDPGTGRTPEPPAGVGEPVAP